MKKNTLPSTNFMTRLAFIYIIDVSFLEILLSQVVEENKRLSEKMTGLAEEVIRV